jgi:hypothetical protein
MKASDQRIQSAVGSTDAMEAAKLIHEFARNHYHLFLVGQYKIRDIGRGICAALDSKNEIVLFNLATAFLEHIAALAKGNARRQGRDRLFRVAESEPSRLPPPRRKARSGGPRLRQN